MALMSAMGAIGPIVLTSGGRLGSVCALWGLRDDPVPGRRVRGPVNDHNAQKRTERSELMSNLVAIAAKSLTSAGRFGSL
jgi:hypothetical protein